MTRGKVPKELREFTRRPYTYTLIDADLVEGVGGVGMYQQRKKGLDGPVFYEVVKIRWRESSTFKDIEAPARYRLPANEDWGRYGWTFRTYEQARAKYDTLCEEFDAKHPDTGTAETPPDAGDAD